MWKYVGSEGFIAVAKKAVFRNITSSSELKINRRLGGTCSLHLQRLRICRERNQLQADSKQGLLFGPEHKSMFLRNVGSFSTGYMVLNPRTRKSSMSRPMKEKSCEDIPWTQLFPMAEFCKLGGQSSNSTLAESLIDCATFRVLCFCFRQAVPQPTVLGTSGDPRLSRSLRLPCHTLLEAHWSRHFLPGEELGNGCIWFSVVIHVLRET